MKAAAGLCGCLQPHCGSLSRLHSLSSISYRISYFLMKPPTPPVLFLATYSSEKIKIFITHFPQGRINHLPAPSSDSALHEPSELVNPSHCPLSTTLSFAQGHCSKMSFFSSPVTSFLSTRSFPLAIISHLLKIKLAKQHLFHFPSQSPVFLLSFTK